MLPCVVLSVAEAVQLVVWLLGYVILLKHPLSNTLRNLAFTPKPHSRVWSQWSGCYVWPGSHTRHGMAVQVAPMLTVAAVSR